MSLVTKPTWCLASQLVCLEKGFPPAYRCQKCKLIIELEKADARVSELQKELAVLNTHEDDYFHDAPNRERLAGLRHHEKRS